MTGEAANLGVALKRAGFIERGIRGTVALTTTVHRRAAAGACRSGGKEEHVFSGRRDRDRALMRFR